MEGERLFAFFDDIYVSPWENQNVEQERKETHWWTS